MNNQACVNLIVNDVGSTAAITGAAMKPTNSLAAGFSKPVVV